MNKKLSTAFAIAISLFLFSASANAETFYAYLSSEQEVPTNLSTATGYARIVINESASTVTWTVVFNNLSSAQTASHIHAPAAIGANTGVVINFPAVGGTSGTITGSGPITPTQISQIRAHQGYVNIHSTNFPGGEIRGQLGIKRSVDFDGDGRQDYSVLKFPNGSPSPISFWNLNSTTGVQVFGTFGDARTDFPTPGDFDGDGKDDLALYRDGTPASPQSAFFIFKTSDSTVQYYAWGVDADIPIARDYDGDGITDVATFRRGISAGAQAVWYIRRSSNNTVQIENWGTTGSSVTDVDVPIPGDYDGDGKFDVAVYRAGNLSPSNNFIIKRSSDGGAVFKPFGNLTTDYIVPGDYDGDGKFDYAVVRTGVISTSPLVWWINRSSDGVTTVRNFGITSDLPTQGDYDGDAVTDLSIYRRGTQSFFWVFNSLTSTTTARAWGSLPDFPVANFDAR